ncbi:hypothetical protein BJX96DRAFT_36034 [Aspergillus floccosus]
MSVGRIPSLSFFGQENRDVCRCKDSQRPTNAAHSMATDRHSRTDGKEKTREIDEEKNERTTAPQGKIERWRSASKEPDTTLPVVREPFAACDLRNTQQCATTDPAISISQWIASERVHSHAYADVEWKMSPGLKFFFFSLSFFNFDSCMESTLRS